MNKNLPLLENRADLSIIADWIAEGSSVLDLGCGKGTLLNYLIRNKSVNGMGIEIDLKRIISCIEKGIPVIEHDLNEKFDNIKDNAYDYVILSQTIQELTFPELLINEILRMGKYGIVSFPNFGFLHVRLQLFFRGRMPKSMALPHDWYNTPNIHLLTLADFKEFCRARGIKIKKIVYFKGRRHQIGMIFPNLLSEGCVILIERI